MLREGAEKKEEQIWRGKLEERSVWIFKDRLKKRRI